MATRDGNAASGAELDWLTPPSVPRFPAWSWDIPDYFNLAVACTDAHATGLRSNAPAVIVDDDERGVSVSTFAELAESTSRFAQLLRELEVPAGGRILLRMPNCPEYSVAFLGAMKRGAVPVPTSFQLTADELRYLLADCGATLLVTDVASWNELRAELRELPFLRHVLVTGAGEPAPSATPSVTRLAPALASLSRWDPPHPTRAEDPAYLVYTSGTTGFPKGVLHAHRVLLGKQPASEYWFSFREEPERVLHSGKYNWTYVLGTGLMDPLYRGHTTIVHEGRQDGLVWPEILARHAATTFIGVPTLYRHILQYTSAGREDVPSLRHCMSAGEHLSREVLHGWRRRFGLEIYEGLGMTECSYYLCQSPRAEVRPGSAGFIQPGHGVALLDPATWKPVPVGSEGMLCIPRHDPALMLGYWNRPDETVACHHGDWFLTGDYARLDEDGYVWFLGRRDDQIKSFGYRVSPLEVDRVLKDHPDVLEAATVGEASGADKVLITAYVILRVGSTCSADDVLRHARQHLANYKAPKVVYLVEDLPRTRNGKVLRRALRPEMARARSES